jgi:predicted transcriptional regulator
LEVAAMDRDLWGDPIPPPEERRGRPKHVPSETTRLRVRVLRAVRKTDREIAEAMGFSEPTLRKHYRRELDGALSQLRAELLVRLWKEVEAGNVSAMKEFRKELEKADLVEACRKFDGAEPPEPRKPKRGKKEEAMAAAETAGAGSEWGDDLHLGSNAKLN